MNTSISVETLAKASSMVKRARRKLVAEYRADNPFLPVYKVEKIAPSYTITITASAPDMGKAVAALFTY